MGIMLKYECAGCGYQTKELPVGGGERPSEFDPRLVSCPSCKTLRVVDAREVERGCRRHRKAFAVYRDETDVPRPRCGLPLATEGTALWD